MGTGITASISPSISFSIPQSSPGTAVTDILAGSKWGTAMGGGASLAYSWSSAASTYTYSFDANVPAPGVVGLTPEQQQGALAAMQIAASYANLSFTLVADGSAAAGDIRWAASSDGDYFARTGSSAFAYYPGSTASAGDVWLDGGLNDLQTTAPGSFGFEDLLHELGHALGLAHPADAGGAADQLTDTVMSYRNFAGDTVHYLAQAYPTTYMPDDVAALQFLYGPNLSTNLGDTNYSWAPGQAVYQTIWDAGGDDTIDASNQASGVVIDLHPGAFSQIGTSFWNGQYDGAGLPDMTKLVHGELAIAYGCTIEEAIGSSYADLLVGNDVANRLFGGGGNDTISGGGGIDTAVYAGHRSQYDVSTAPDGTVTVASHAGGDTDTVCADVERLEFADVTVALDASGDVGQVWRLYRVALQRDADPAGQGFWMKQLEQGASLLSVANAFVGSAEFKAAWGGLSDAQFVTKLYETALGREPAADELAWQLGAMHSSSRAQLLLNFSESPENVARTILANDGAAAQVWRLYDAAFHRAPDTAGFEFNVQAMAAGGASLEQMARCFMASPEFTATYGQPGDAQFVTLLYENVLGRAPDAAGLAYQLGQLGAGATRAQLMANFSESPEHCAEAQFVGVIHEGVAFVAG